MDEFESAFFVVGTDHYAHMPNVASATTRSEEYEIAFAEIFAVYRRPFRILCPGRRAYGITELSVHVACESGTIKLVWPFCPVYITFADMPVGFFQEVGNQLSRF